MARRNTLPEVSGGSGLLRDALGSSVSRVEAKTGPQREFSAVGQELPPSARNFPKRGKCASSKVYLSEVFLTVV